MIIYNYPQYSHCERKRSRCHPEEPAVVRRRRIYPFRFFANPEPNIKIWYGANAQNDKQRLAMTIGLCLITYVLASCTLMYAQEEPASFKYESRGRRDPFIPLVTEDGKLTITYGTLESLDDVLLEGILYDPAGESVVIMNDLVLKEGSSIGKIQIKKIYADKVILSFNGEDHTFKLKE